jgi:hypothetical protein
MPPTKRRQLRTGEYMTLDFDPPYLHPDYRSTLLRSPSRPLVRLPADWFHRARGPVFGRIKVRPDEADLTRHHGGEPLGERIIVTGRVVARSPKRSSKSGRRMLRAAT